MYKPRGLRNTGQPQIMMMYRLRGKAFLCAQVNNKFLYVYCRYLLERVLTKVGGYVLDGIIIE